MKKKYKIFIHPLYYAVFFICFFTGYLKYYLIYTLVIIVHELGHIFAGLMLKWPISNVTIYPFGCMTTFNNKINSSLLEEFLILLYGPLFQILFYRLFPTNCHFFILAFNLLPIYPLDGSKLLLIVLNKFFSFYYSYIIVYIISFITIFFIMISYFSFINLLIFMYLLFDLYRYIFLLKDIMYMFYYERYKLNYKYKKTHNIYGNNKHRMFKEKNNIFIIDKKCYKEKEFLRKMFDK